MVWGKLLLDKLVDSSLFDMITSAFNERKLVLGLQHVKVKVKVKVQMEKFRNKGGLPRLLDGLEYC